MRKAVVISFLLFWVSETTLERICKYHDVAEYLNISSNRELYLYTIPKKNWKEPLVLSLDFTLISILSVKEKLQMVTMYFWIILKWDNEFVSWNPLDFCNISTVTLPVNLFWLPDIFIDERADEDKLSASSYIDISSNGSVHTFQAYRLTSSCNLDVYDFPFDEQKCNLTVTSSIHTDNEIKIKNAKSSKKTNQDSRKMYLTNGEWQFLELKIFEELEVVDMSSYTAIIYEISMKRRSILYVLVLILPTFILFLLDMAISFTLASVGDKIAFKITLILEVSVLSLILNDMLPSASDDPPVIAMFFTGVFLFMILGILENALIVYLREKKLKLAFFKEWTFVNKFLRKEKKETENPVADSGSLTDEMSMKNKRLDTFALPEKDSLDTLVCLKQLNVELQQIKKHLALEGCQDDPESANQAKCLLFLERGLCYSRLVLSLFFLVFIGIQWKH